MLAIYSLILTLGFTLMIPLFILRRDKYAAGFRQRLGNYPEFEHDGRPVIWLHCVSVGEANAARPLIHHLDKAFPNHRLIISTTTKTGQKVVRKVFKGKADAVIYFPFDWKFSVRRALANYKPSVVLLMETEIWPRFIREAKLGGAKVAMVNGRLSQRSVDRYMKVRRFLQTVLDDVDLALMQNKNDAERLLTLGIAAEKVKVTGNIKSDHSVDAAEAQLTEELQARFAIDGYRPLIVAASTHDPEERWVLESLAGIDRDFRLLIAPRHPERFDDVARLLDRMNKPYVRRSRPEIDSDRYADIILLDTIGELRSVYPLADIVFVGGSLIQHGGQSVLEPAAAGSAMMTGPFTHNFDSIVKELVKGEGLVQLGEFGAESVAEALGSEFLQLLDQPRKRFQLSENARTVIAANRGATDATIRELRATFGFSGAA